MVIGLKVEKFRQKQPINGEIPTLKWRDSDKTPAL